MADSSKAVDVVFTRVAGFSEERTGVTRRHSEFNWQYNASVDIVEVGTTTNYLRLVGRYRCSSGTHGCGTAGP